MSTPDPDLARAIALMVEALEILDRCGEAAAAAHLQYAHDVALSESVASLGQVAPFRHMFVAILAGQASLSGRCWLASGQAFVWEGIRTQSSAYLCGDRGFPDGSSQADAIEAAAVLVSVVDLLAQRGQIRLSDKVNASFFEEGIDPRRIVEGWRGEAKPIRPMPVNKAQESVTGLALAFVDFNRFVTFIEYDKNRGVHKASVVGAKRSLVLDLLPFPTDYS